MRKAAFLLAMALAAPASGQNFDEGVPPGSSPISAAPGQVRYPDALSNQQLEQMNGQANALAKELQQIDIQLAVIDELLEGYDRGDFLVFLSGFRAVWTEAELRRKLAQTDPRNSVAINPFTLDGLDPDLQVYAYRGWSTANAETLVQERLPLFRRRAEIGARLDEIRRIVIADADRPGQAYDPNAAYDTDEERVQPFEWDTKTRIYGIECFGGAEYEVYTDHFSLNGRYMGVDRIDYDKVRAPLVASGAQFCGAWETGREDIKRGATAQQAPGQGALKN